MRLGIVSLPARVTFSIFISFFPILVATATGAAISGDNHAAALPLVAACRSGKFSSECGFRHRFPSSFSGMKIAVTLAIIGIVVVRVLIASQQGLGYLHSFCLVAPADRSPRSPASQFYVLSGSHSTAVSLPLKSF